MAKLSLDVQVERLPYKAAFRISGYVFDGVNCVIATLSDGTYRGRGEANGIYYMGDDVPHMLAALEHARADIEAGADRAALREIMPAGGARNAVDAALWELEAQRSGLPVWKLAGLPEAKPVVTTFTLGADDPALMAASAVAFGPVKAIKIKLTGDLDLDIARVRAVRAARPDVWLGVDGNQGFKIADLDALAAAMVTEKVSLIEQPLARGREADLDGYRSPVPIAADESALTLADVPGLEGRFQVVNIKLDKCGGLTEGLMIARAARDIGLDVMVGNMGGSSLSMAPSLVLGQLCDICDLDGPIFLKEDRNPGIVYQDGTAWCDERVWGAESRVAA
ncbi:dipeptide epimerase [Sphingomonas lycopersici]|uniref:Dipeptide epimerase n=1 Tax=Sphingomonas lycopersici TaxID=2951807 RepID=A0AA42CQB3_9SPHN|nr:dipeptide epimerase [Sphingomonas lycopersici]MCW6531036.1 dipeptide epimerase [Sphingomonas lycopersici]MCW6534722.1 dipeptide epimerase [Sphingomonas lycopersici]